MVVLTFSGRAVADAQPLGLAAAVVGRQAGPRVVVVPALAGIPERLDQMIRFAREGRLQAARALAARVAGRHRDLVLRAAPGSATEVVASIDTWQAELEAVVTAASDPRGVSHELDEAAQATGSLLSSSVVAAVLREAGIAATRVDATNVFVADGDHGSASPRFAETAARIQQQIAPILSAGGVPVIAGGVAATPAGMTATMGPGGVMLSAAIVSAAIGARELQMWIEADGVLAADPSVVPTAHSVPQLSFAEALELARWGMTSLHAGSLELATSRDLPIVIRNARRPDRPGTIIDGQPAVGVAAPAALAWRRGAVALQFSSRETRAPVFMRRILDLCGNSGEAPFVATISGPSVVVAFEDRARADRVATAAHEFAQVTPLDDVALLSAVGESLAADPRIAAGVLEAVKHVTVHASARHPSGRSLTLLVDDADAGEAMRRVYERFFAAAEPPAPGCLAKHCEF